MSEVRTPFGRVGFAIWWLSELRHREEVCAAFTEAIDFAVNGGSFEVAAAIRDLRDALQPGWETDH